ncbi:MAG: hypothetical protein EOO08_13570 [Chitinophagaceae bacterium]|nr:MAG: hypothetical protein EOO08_13570 [Chitinophagaceae bacterium]
MKWIPTILVLLLFAARSGAQVNALNGNFQISYSDVATNEDLQVSRSFNSLTVTTGYFGLGWSSNLETRLVPLPDGTVGIEWWGGVSRDIAPAARLDKDAHYAMVRAVVAAEIAEGKLANIPAEILRRKGELQTDDNQLYTRYLNQVAKGGIKQRVAAPRSRQSWRIDTNQELEWDGKRYRHRTWNTYYYFDSAGRLTQVQEPAAHMELRYHGNALDRIILDKHAVCSVKMDTAGRITSITMEDSGQVKKAVYRYDTAQRLMYSCDIDSNQYVHAYDAVTNMTEIRYTDSTRMLIEYDPATFRVTRLTRRNGTSQQFEYISFYNEYGENDPNHYGSRITSFDSLGKRSFGKYQEWQHRTLPDGSDYLYRIINRSDTSFSDNIYGPNVGNVIYRKLNEAEAWAEYDAKRRCVYLRMNDSVFRVQYRLDEQPGRFWAIDSLRRDTVAYQYFYNKNGQLASVLRGKERFVLEAAPSDSVKVIRREQTRWRITYAKGVAVRASSPAWPDLDLNTDASDPKRRQAQEEARRFAEAVEPRLIPHEWIWERLGKKG